MIVHGKGSIENRVRREEEGRRLMRRQEDILKGLTKADTAQRGDFKECREYDKVMADYRRYKNPNDRKKITEEYYGRQRENKR